MAETLSGKFLVGNNLEYSLGWTGKFGKDIRESHRNPAFLQGVLFSWVDT